MRHSHSYGEQAMVQYARSDMKRELQVTSQILENTTDSFTRLASSVGVLEQEVQELKLHDFAHQKTQNHGISAEDSAEMNLRRLISIAHDIGGTTAASTADNEVAALQAELGTICKAEMALKEIHKQRCFDLQDSWDKLVSLRKHIAQFRAAIEETTIEDVHNQAYYFKADGTRNSRGYSDRSCAHLSRTSQALGATSPRPEAAGESIGYSAAGLGKSIDEEVKTQVLRERVRVRDALRQRAADMEKKMDLIREDLRKSASVLAESSQILDRVPGAVGMAGNLRMKLMNESKVLEDMEVEYVSLRQHLLNMEAEVSESLRVVGGEAGLGYQNALREAHFHSVKATSNAAGLFPWSTGEAMHTPSTTNSLPSYEEDDVATARAAMLDPPKGSVECNFTLQEVLDGKAKLFRMNGENASVYRARLQKRMAGLLLLVAQLQAEVDQKAIAVKDARDELREFETKRLRLELRVANICTILQQRRSTVESRYLESMQESVLHPLNQSQDASLYNLMTMGSVHSSKNTDISIGRHSDSASTRPVTADNIDITTEFDDHPFHLADHQDSRYGTESGEGRDWIISPGAGKYMRSAIGSLKEDDELTADTHRKNARDMMQVAVNLLNSEYGVASVPEKCDETVRKGGQHVVADGPVKLDREMESEPSDPPPLEDIVSSALNTFSVPDHDESDAALEAPKYVTPRLGLSKSQSMPTPSKSPKYDKDGHLIAGSGSPTRRNPRRGLDRRKSSENTSSHKRNSDKVQSSADDKLKNRVPSFQRRSRSRSPRPVAVSTTGTPVKTENDLNALSTRLNTVADRAVTDCLGADHVGASTPEVKMVRQEAVIAELLSILLQGGGANEGSLDISRDYDGKEDRRDRQDILEDISLDDVVFLLQEQQQELAEIRQIAIKQNKGEVPSVCNADNSFDCSGKVSGFYNGVHHSPLSPILVLTEEVNETKGRSVRISLSGSTRHATPSPDTRDVGGPGGRSRPRSESPVRSTSSSKWIGGGTASSHHIQAQENRFDYPPLNALPEERGRSASPAVRGRSRLTREQMDRRVRSRSESRDSKSEYLSSSPEGQKRSPLLHAVDVHTPLAERIDIKGDGGLWSLSDSTDHGGKSEDGAGGEGDDSKFKYPFSSNHRTRQDSHTGGGVYGKGLLQQDRLALSPLRGIDMSGILVPADESTIVEEIAQSSRDDETLLELQLQLEKFKTRLFESLNTEKGTDTKARLDITVMNIRDMPELNKVTHSADCFVEMAIGHGSDSTVPPISSTRTITKWNERYPEWRDDPKELTFPIDENSHILSNLVLSVAVLNASRSGKDEVFARTLLPLHLLVDQNKHSFWLRLCCPSDAKAQKFGRSRPRIPDNCALRVDIRLTYAKDIYWRNRITLTEHKIAMSKGAGNVLAGRFQPVARKKMTLFSQEKPQLSNKTVSNDSHKKVPVRRGVHGARDKDIQDSPSVVCTYSGKKEVMTISELSKESEHDGSNEEKDIVVSKVPKAGPNLSIFRGAGVCKKYIKGKERGQQGGIWQYCQGMASFL